EGQGTLYSSRSGLSPGRHGTDRETGQRELAPLPGTRRQGWHGGRPLSPGNERLGEGRVYTRAISVGGGSEPLPGDGSALEARPLSHAIGPHQHGAGRVRTGTGTAGTEPGTLPRPGRQ